jgi:hypothetical protein
MVLGSVPFKIVSDIPALHWRWLLLLKIEISSIVHCIMFDTMLTYGRFAIYLCTMLTYLNMYDHLLLSFYFLLLLLLHFVFVNLCLNDLSIFLWCHSDICRWYGQLCFCFSLILYLEYEFILQLMVWLFR